MAASLDFLTEILKSGAHMPVQTNELFEKIRKLDDSVTEETIYYNLAVEIAVRNARDCNNNAFIRHLPLEALRNPSSYCAPILWSQISSVLGEAFPTRTSEIEPRGSDLHLRLPASFATYTSSIESSETTKSDTLDPSLSSETPLTNFKRRKASLVTVNEPNTTTSALSTTKTSGSKIGTGKRRGRFGKTSLAAITDSTLTNTTDAMLPTLSSPHIHHDVEFTTIDSSSSVRQPVVPYALSRGSTPCIEISSTSSCNNPCIDVSHMTETIASALIQSYDSDSLDTPIITNINISENSSLPDGDTVMSTGDEIPVISSCVALVVMAKFASKQERFFDVFLNPNNRHPLAAIQIMQYSSLTLRSALTASHQRSHQNQTNKIQLCTEAYNMIDSVIQNFDTRYQTYEAQQRTMLGFVVTPAELALAELQNKGAIDALAVLSFNSPLKKNTNAIQTKKKQGTSVGSELIADPGLDDLDMDNVEAKRAAEEAVLFEARKKIAELHANVAKASNIKERKAAQRLLEAAASNPALKRGSGYVAFGDTDINGQLITHGDFDHPVDPNEPVYCTCHSAAHGEMVACDNDDCTIEWFHVGCVGYQKTGKDKRWCCAACKASGYVFK